MKFNVFLQILMMKFALDKPKDQKEYTQYLINIFNTQFCSQISQVQHEHGHIWGF